MSDALGKHHKDEQERNRRESDNWNQPPDKLMLLITIVFSAAILLVGLITYFQIGG